MQENSQRRSGEDQSSVIHSKEEDSPREEIDRDEQEAAPAGHSSNARDQEKDEGMLLEPNVTKRRPVVTDAPADISPLSIVDEDDVGAVVQSDEETMREYERKAARSEDRESAAS